MKKAANRGLILSICFAVGGGPFAATHAYAAYPDRPIKYIVPFAPGGESDIAARFQQLVVKKKYGQELIVESKPGAGGALAWSQTNTFPGDGYTSMSTNLPHLVLQPMEGTVQYKTEDIQNVCFFHYTPDAIVVRSESPFKTYQDLVKAAKEKPNEISIAGSGTNSANHLATERFNGAAGVKTTYVPFKGTGDLVASLLGGHVSMAMSYVDAGHFTERPYSCAGGGDPKAPSAISRCADFQGARHRLGGRRLSRHRTAEIGDAGNEEAGVGHLHGNQQGSRFPPAHGGRRV